MFEASFQTKSLEFTCSLVHNASSVDSAASVVVCVASMSVAALKSIHNDDQTGLHTFVYEEFVTELVTVYSTATGQCELIHGINTW